MGRLQQGQTQPPGPPPQPQVRGQTPPPAPYPTPQPQPVPVMLPPYNHQQPLNPNGIGFPAAYCGTHVHQQSAATYYNYNQSNPRPYFPAPSQYRGFIGVYPWTTDLFGCMEDPTNALITLLLPFITFGQIAEVIDNGNTTCMTSGIMYAVLPCMISRPYRTKLRRMFGLVESPSPDWLVHFMFEPCALCQEYRELSNRGIHPALGYHANREKLQNLRGAPSQMMVPPKNQIMV